ncbi:hypothetical protein [Chromohalobacter canadensis]|uniref:flagellin N-terminal helical domain-containing protein n=1 Tax=Chromohalobacter canadensis TaxID=141389 RepID=UPI00240FED01|nr:hypothetical protein [Chromohalobacter canadensis]
MAVINSNLLSLTAQQHQGRANSQFSSTLERLSSGLKIKSTADDAAGQTICNRMEANLNANDSTAKGISQNMTKHLFLAFIFLLFLSGCGDDTKKAKELAKVSGMKEQYENLVDRFSENLLKEYDDSSITISQVKNTTKESFSWSAFENIFAKIYSKKFNSKEIDALIKVNRSSKSAQGALNSKEELEAFKKAQQLYPRIVQDANHLINKELKKAKTKVSEVAFKNAIRG